jgi:hypothetical protein
MRELTVLPCAGLLLEVLGCGAAPSVLITKPTSLDTVGAPHEQILIRNSGLYRVWLDTAETEVFDEAPSAIAVNDTMSIHIADRRYVIVDHGREKVVEGVVAASEPILSPDSSRFVVVQTPLDLLGVGQHEIALVTLADATVRRYPVPLPNWSGWGEDALWAAERGRDQGQAVWFDKWGLDSSAVWFTYGSKRFRLVLESGAIDFAEDESKMPARSDAGTKSCAARGVLMEVQDADGRQEIVLLPLAGASANRPLTTQPRKLVSATHAYWHPHMGSEPPQRLGEPRFTRSCEHFVFGFNGNVFVGNATTGKFAYLIAGGSPTPLVYYAHAEQ